MANVADQAQESGRESRERFVAETYRLHGRMVFNACARLLDDTADVEDATQAVFVLLDRKFKGAGHPRETAAWLYRTAVLVAREAQRARRRRAHYEREAALMAQQSSAGPEAGWAEVRPLLDGCLAALPERYRSPLVLVYLDGVPQKEAAAALGLKEGTLRWRLTEGLERLRARLSKEDRSCSVLALTAMLGEHARAVRPPDALEETIVHAARGSPAGARAASNPNVANLVEEAMKTQQKVLVRTAAGAAAAVLVLAVASGWIYRARAEEVARETREVAPPAAFGASSVKELTTQSAVQEKAAPVPVPSPSKESQEQVPAAAAAREEKKDAVSGFADLKHEILMRVEDDGSVIVDFRVSFKNPMPVALQEATYPDASNQKDVLEYEILKVVDGEGRAVTVTPGETHKDADGMFRRDLNFKAPVTIPPGGSYTCFLSFKWKSGTIVMPMGEKNLWQIGLVNQFSMFGQEAAGKMVVRLPKDARVIYQEKDPEDSYKKEGYPVLAFPAKNGETGGMLIYQYPDTGEQIDIKVKPAQLAQPSKEAEDF